MKHTSLFDRHVKLGAKMVPFAGFQMPVTYPGSLKIEYNAVRNKTGIFDVSHMGQIRISGNAAFEFLQKVTINNVDRISSGKAQYSAMCYENGGIIDDLIVYRSADDFLLVVNASNIDKNLSWLEKNKIADVKISNESEQTSLIAIQGPESREILKHITKDHLDLSFYSFMLSEYNNKSIMISRTGYTGELGFEIYGEHDSVQNIWDILMATGEIQPVGLAVRDILRMEMKYCLYGNDIDETKNPIEAGLGWITDLKKDNFLGKDAISGIKRDKPEKRLIAFIMDERGIPRPGYEIQKENNNIGIVTSGTQSLGLQKGIGLAYVSREFSKSGTEIDVLIRNKPIPAKIIKPPFIKETSLLSQ